MHVPLNTQMALSPDKSDAGQSRAVIKESETGVEAALDHPSDGEIDLRPGRDQFANMQVRACTREESSVN